MMKRFAAACLLLPLIACTSTPSVPGAAPRVFTASKAPAPVAGCAPASATRLPARAADCTGVGRAYTQEDLYNTGQATVAGALRMMDPGISVRGH